MSTVTCGTLFSPITATTKFRIFQTVADYRRISVTGRRCGGGWAPTDKNWSPLGVFSIGTEYSVKKKPCHTIISRERNIRTTTCVYLLQLSAKHSAYTMYISIVQYKKSINPFDFKSLKFICLRCWYLMYKTDLGLLNFDLNKFYYGFLKNHLKRFYLFFVVLCSYVNET